jgi:hypothetical protein
MNRPPLPAPPHKGGCLCGAVRYRVDARPMGVNACHCSDCKKLSGGTHIVTVLVPREAFNHEKGEVARFRKRAASAREIDLVRCATCGVRLWHEPISSPALIILAAGTLDDPAWTIPASHIWIEKAAADFPFEDGCIKLQGQPLDRQVLIDAFAKIYPA